jgi:prephenate dehydrogenase
MNMKVGILGLGPVGQSFVYVSTKFGPGYKPHQLYVYDKNPEKMKALEKFDHIHLCENEGEVGLNSDLLMCCTDMLNADAITKAMVQMKDGSVVSDDFSAKIPALEAYKAAGMQLPYWSVHTMFSPKMGFKKGRLVIEIPVRYCMEGNRENPYITEFRETMKGAGAQFKKIYLVSDHDQRMGRIQGATSAENICTAATLAELGINPLEEGGGVYSNELDKANFQMALRAIGEPGGSNSTVYGLIAMMNPYSLKNIVGYANALETLIGNVGRGGRGASDMLETAIENLGHGRVDEASALWDTWFGPIDEADNSYSSHLAEALVWSHPREYPLEIFAETPSPPYRIREVMALKALSMYKTCIRNMKRGGTHDEEFLQVVQRYKDWADRSVDAVNTDKSNGPAQLAEFESTFFNPVRATFSDELVDIGKKTNELIARTV